MKKVFFIILILTTTYLYALDYKEVVILKGRNIQISNADFGLPMPMSEAVADKLKELETLKTREIKCKAKYYLHYTYPRGGGLSGDYIRTTQLFDLECDLSN